MQSWSLQRKISLVMHLIFLSIPFGASTVAAFMWWKGLFNDPWFAAIIIITLEVLCLSSLAMRIARIPWPLAWVRHGTPFISVVPLLYELYVLLEPINGGWAVPITIVVGGWAVFLSFKLFASFERLWIDRVTATREAAAARFQHLTADLAEWELIKDTFDTFTAGVQRYGYPTQHVPTVEDVTPPARPILQIPADAGPKLQQIVKLAMERTDEGWAYSLADIQREVRANANTVNVVASLVRQGHVAVAQGGSDE